MNKFRNMVFVMIFIFLVGFFYIEYFYENNHVVSHGDVVDLYIKTVDGVEGVVIESTDSQGNPTSEVDKKYTQQIELYDTSGDEQSVFGTTGKFTIEEDQISGLKRGEAKEITALDGTTSVKLGIEVKDINDCSDFGNSCRK